MSLKDYSDIELKEELEERGDYELSNFDTETLQCALRDRNEEFVYENQELTDVYYAMRDGDLDKVIELMNPLLWESIGRKV